MSHLKRPTHTPTFPSIVLTSKYLTLFGSCRGDIDNLKNINANILTDLFQLIFFAQTTYLLGVCG